MAQSLIFFKIVKIWQDRCDFGRVGVRLRPLIRNVTEAMDFLSRSYLVILQCKPINNNTSEKNNETFDAPALNGADDRHYDRMQER